MSRFWAKALGLGAVILLVFAALLLGVHVSPDTADAVTVAAVGAVAAVAGVAAVAFGLSVGVVGLAIGAVGLVIIAVGGLTFATGVLGIAALVIGGVALALALAVNEMIDTHYARKGECGSLVIMPASVARGLAFGTITAVVIGSFVFGAVSSWAVVESGILVAAIVGLVAAILGLIVWMAFCREVPENTFGAIAATSFAAAVGAFAAAAFSEGPAVAIAALALVLGGLAFMFASEAIAGCYPRENS